MKNFGLSPNTDYDGQDITVKHKNGDSYTLIRTTAKMLIVVGGAGKEKRMRADSLVGVGGTVSSDVSENPLGHDELINLTKEKEWLFGSEYFDNDFAMAGDPNYKIDEQVVYD